MNSVKPNQNLLDVIILIIRLFAGLSMLTHGLPKLEKLVTSNHIEFMNLFGMGSVFSLMLAVFAEFFCSIFIIFGFLTRLACIPLMITMLVACFVVHAADPYQTKELSVVYFFLYVTILTLGSGKFSIDDLLAKKETY